MPYRRRGGLIRGAARTAAIAGTASAVSGRVHRRQQQKWAQQDLEAQQQADFAAQQAAAAAPPPPAAAPAGDDVIGKLKELASLHESGILDDAEFAAAKAKLLGS